MLHGLRPRFAAPLVLAVWALAAAPGSAAAAGSPLHVDPASPVAKAYALPIGAARGASGGGRSSALFGSGLRPGSGTDRNRARGRAVPAAYRVLEPGSGTGALWMLVAAAVVIATGGGVALALSRRR